MTATRRARIRSCGALVAMLVFTSSASSYAQPEGAEPEADAKPEADGAKPEADATPDGAKPEADATPESDALFREGRVLMQDAEQLDRACELLAKSYELRQRGDVLLNLAECHRRQGKTATAWREFDEAIRYAEEVAFTEAIEAAVKLRDELAKSLSGLLVEIPADPAPPAGLAIELDGKPLPPAQWGQPLFVDPGKHTVTATAKGYEPFENSSDVQAEGHRAVIQVVLKKLPEPPKPEPEPPKPEPAPKPAPPPPAEDAEVPVWAFVAGSAGIIMLGMSVGFGIDTVSVGGELDDQCGGDERLSCPTVGDESFNFDTERSNELRSFGAFIGFGIAGLLATGVGAIGLGMGLAAGDDKQVAFTPWAGPHGAGLAVRGTRW